MTPYKKNQWKPVSKLMNLIQPYKNLYKNHRTVAIQWPVEAGEGWPCPEVQGWPIALSGRDMVGIADIPGAVCPGGSPK